MSKDNEDPTHFADFGNGTTSPSASKSIPPTSDGLSKATTGHRSEHGHSVLRIRPMSKHSGTSVVTFFNGLFQTILAVGTLGASITFNYVLSNTVQPPLTSNPHFTPEQVHLFLSISWLLFLLAVAFAALGETLLTFFGDHWKADWDGLNGETSQTSVRMYAVVASGTMGGLIIGAFILLCLVVVAYSSVVGWIALGFTCFFGIIILMAVFNQIPWEWGSHIHSTSESYRTRTV